MSFMSTSSSIFSAGPHPVPEASQISMGGSSTSSSMSVDRPLSLGLVARVADKIMGIFSTFSDAASMGSVSAIPGLDSSPTKRPRSPDIPDTYGPTKRQKRDSYGTDDEIDEVADLLFLPPAPILKTACTGIAEGTPWLQLDLGDDESESEDPNYDPDNPTDHLLDIEALILKNSLTHFGFPYSWPARHWDKFLVDETEDDDDTWDDEVRWHKGLGDPLPGQVYDDSVFNRPSSIIEEDLTPEEESARHKARQEELERLYETGQASLLAERNEEELEMQRAHDELQRSRHMKKRPLRRAATTLVKHPFKPDTYLGYKMRQNDVLGTDSPQFQQTLERLYGPSGIPKRPQFEFSKPRRRFECWADFDY